MTVVTDDLIRQSLKNMSDEIEINAITYPEYAVAFDSISQDGIVIYDFFKMIVKRAKDSNVTLDNARELVLSDIKTLEKAVLSLGKKAPIIKGIY